MRLGVQDRLRPSKLPTSCSTTALARLCVNRRLPSAGQAPSAVMPMQFHFLQNPGGIFGVDVLDGSLPLNGSGSSSAKVIAGKLPSNPGGISGEDVLGGTILSRGLSLECFFSTGSHSEVSHTTAAEWLRTIVPLATRLAADSAEATGVQLWGKTSPPLATVISHPTATELIAFEV